MTMQIDVKITSPNRIGKVSEVDIDQDGKESIVSTHILNPGESVQVLSWNNRFIKVEEVEEIKA